MSVIVSTDATMTACVPMEVIASAGISSRRATEEGSVAQREPGDDALQQPPAGDGYPVKYGQTGAHQRVLLPVSMR